VHYIFEHKISFAVLRGRHGFYGAMAYPREVSGGRFGGWPAGIRLDSAADSEGMREQVAERVRSNELAPYVMSIPGIGTAGISWGRESVQQPCSGGQLCGACATCGLFGDAGALWAYRGVPVLPSDRECNTGRGALGRSGKGPLFQKYDELSGRMNKRKSAVARKMVSLA
jgi:hypothetical protein